MRWLALALVLVACARAPSGTPEDAVRGFFSAVASHDCNAVERSIAGKVAAELRHHGCDAMLAEYQKHGVSLLDVDAAKVDGRDHEARLVTATIMKDGKTDKVIVRVEPYEGTWRVVVL